MKRLNTLWMTAAVLLPLPSFAAWQVEPSHTHIGFAVGHLGLTKTPGIFRKFDAKLAFDDKHIDAASISLAIDAASIDTNNELRDGHLQGADWFDAGTYPKVLFVSRSVRKAGENHYLIAGDLTIRGQTRPVEFDTALTNRAVNPWMKVAMIGFAGAAKIKRSDFGMTTFLPAISDEVELTIQLELLDKP